MDLLVREGVLYRKLSSTGRLSGSSRAFLESQVSQNSWPLARKAALEMFDSSAE